MQPHKAIEYLTQTSWRESRLGLARMEELLRRMGQPQNRLPFVHVAGTNGKSSVSAMAAGVLAAAGYTTGLYTSPYVNCFNERMQVNGVPISDDELSEMTAEVRRHADAMADHPTEFELITALALAWFLRRGCQVVVLEVGLGGRLDATNIIPTPAAALITTIDLDHTQILGDSLPAIAAEKAGIVKQDGLVVLYPQAPAVQAVFEDACRRTGSRLVPVDLSTLWVEPVKANSVTDAATGADAEGSPQADAAGTDAAAARCPALPASLPGGPAFAQHFSYDGLENLSTPLLGPYQPRNAALVITAMRQLRAAGWHIADDAMRRGLAATHWPARFELMRTHPAVIVDGGHNPQGVAALREGLARYFPGRPVTFVVGVMADKDYPAMFGQLVPLARRVVCVTPNNPRALPAEELAAFFAARGVAAVACATVAAGVQEALRDAGPNDVVCAFGSLYMAGEVRACFDACALGAKGV